MTTSWAQLRQQLRQLESQTEGLFHTYSQFASAGNLGASPSSDESSTEQQISKALGEREGLVASLARSLESEAQASALKTSHLTRHRSLLQEHRTEYARIKAQVSAARDRVNLLSSVRADIQAYRAANPENAEAEYMLQERGRLDRSHTEADGVLSQAYAINDSFTQQREQLERVRRRITTAVSMVPGVNGLIQKIGIKRRRDGIILGSFIAFCFLAFLYFS